MSRDILDYLMDILEECNYLLRKTSNMSYKEFMRNEDLQKAFVRSLEIIGEASKKVPEKEKRKYPDIKWENIVGMRNILTHEYFNVDYEVVWKTIENRIPELRAVIQNMVNEIKEENDE